MSTRLRWLKSCGKLLLRHRGGHRAIVGAVVCTISGCGENGPSLPTSPSDGDAVLALDVECQPSLLIGERGSCIAVARLSSGGTSLVIGDSTWISSRPDIVAVGNAGLITGRSPGRSIVSASYGGKRNSAPVEVVGQDAVRVRSAVGPNELRVFSQYTLSLQGFYSVWSAESGRLSLRFSDQDGVLATTSPQTVAKGGDYFNLSLTLTVPQRSTRVCGTVVLEVGPVTVTDGSEVTCVPVRP